MGEAVRMNGVTVGRLHGRCLGRRLGLDSIIAVTLLNASRRWREPDEFGTTGAGCADDVDGTLMD